MIDGTPFWNTWIYLVRAARFVVFGNARHGCALNGHACVIFLVQVGPITGGALAGYTFKWLNRDEVLRAPDDVSKGAALYVMEAIGTFYLVLTVSLTSNALCIGFMLSAMIYCGGHISGAHYNPVAFAALPRTWGGGGHSLAAHRRSRSQSSCARCRRWPRGVAPRGASAPRLSQVRPRRRARACERLGSALGRRAQLSLPLLSHTGCLGRSASRTRADRTGTMAPSCLRCISARVHAGPPTRALARAARADPLHDAAVLRRAQRGHAG